MVKPIPVTSEAVEAVKKSVFPVQSAPVLRSRSTTNLATSSLGVGITSSFFGLLPDMPFAADDAD